MENRFLLICGVFGVGKSTIIKKIISLDKRFVYIFPFITRPLRPKEYDKISISKKEFSKMEKNKEFLIVNEFFGIKYGTPINKISKCFKYNKFPILDWQAKDLKKIISFYKKELFIVYLIPPSIEILQKRIISNNRNEQTKRFNEAKKEIKNLKKLSFNKFIDLFIVNEEGKENEIALKIMDKFFNF
jgi:guanylate kinase